MASGSVARALPCLLLLAGAGCGTPGVPSAPSLMLPTAAEDVTAARVEASVHLTWTVPTHTTDRLRLKPPVLASVCRVEEADAAAPEPPRPAIRLARNPCSEVGALTLNPGQHAAFTDHLPLALTQGPPRLLRYQVDLRNHAGKSAAPGTPAYAAAGAAPPALTGLAAQVHKEGVLLSWHPAVVAAASEPASQTGASAASPATQAITLIRIQRERVETAADSPPARPAPRAAGPTGNLAAPPPAPTQQTLVVRAPGAADPGKALDPSAVPDQHYRYTVDRVLQLSVAGHEVELAGQPSDPVLVDTRDVFPPAVPQQLAAAADAAAGAIDLSWAPDSEPDLAGYYVYRRDLAGARPAERIAPGPGSTTPVPRPGYRDTTTQPGHSYAYSVSAIDLSGNQSARSAEATERLPERTPGSQP